MRVETHVCVSTRHSPILRTDAHMRLYHCTIIPIVGNTVPDSEGMRFN